MFRGTYIYSSSFIYYSLRVCYELTTNTIIVHSSLRGPALDFTTVLTHCFSSSMFSYLEVTHIGFSKINKRHGIIIAGKNSFKYQ